MGNSNQVRKEAPQKAQSKTGPWQRFKLWWEEKALMRKLKRDDTAVATLLEMGDGAVPVLLRLLKSEKHRAHAAHLTTELAKAGMKPGTPVESVLGEMLMKDRNAFVKQCAAMALANIETDSAVRILAMAAENHSSEVREIAVISLKIVNDHPVAAKALEQRAANDKNVFISNRASVPPAECK